MSGPPVAQSVNISPTALTFTGPGQQQSLTAFPVGSRGQPLDKVVTFTSSNVTVATVASETPTRAKVTSVAAGTATITASVDGKDASATVTVTCAVRSLLVAPPSIARIFVGGRQQRLTATIDTDPGCSTVVDWTSANSAIATVDASGNVTAVSEGTTSIIARSRQDNAKSATVPVTVVRVINVDLPARDTVLVGQSKTLTAATNPPGGVLVWVSENPAVATVSDGVVTGVSDGNVNIIARSEADPTKQAVLSLRSQGRVASVTVNPAGAVVTVGQTTQLSATVTADAGVSRDVTWTTDNPAVATVSTTGLVSAVGHGSARITATSVADGTKRGTSAIDARGIVRSVSVSPSTVQLGAATSAQLTATVSADPGVSTSVTWSSSNNAVATVSPTGLVTGVSDGSATITARSFADAKISGSATATVTSVSILISPRTPTVSVGGSTQLAATVTAPPGSSTAVNWFSRNTAIATISSSGVATGVATGQTYIVAQSAIAAGAVDSVLLAVTQCVPTAVSFTPSSIPSLLPGGSVQLSAQAVGCPGIPAVTWTTNNLGVASVSTTGLLTAIARGSAVITARLALNPSIQFSASVQVIDVISVSVNPSSDSVRAGTGVGPAYSKQLSATVSADPGVPLGVTWSSSNPAVAAVSPTGLVTGFALGTATITARSTANASKTGAATIKVGDGCTIPHMIAVGQTITGAVGASSCLRQNLPTEYFGYRLTTAQGLQVTATAPWNMQFAPIELISGSYWYWPNLLPGTFAGYVAAASGTYRSFVGAATAGNFGNVSLGVVGWTLAGCPTFTSTTNLIIQLAITSACGPYNWSGAPPGTYYTQFIDLLPPFDVGQTLTVQAVGSTGFQPHIELVSGTGAFLAGGGTGGTSVTLNYFPAAFNFVRLRLSAFSSFATGNVTLTITGPPANVVAAGVKNQIRPPWQAFQADEKPCRTALCEGIMSRGPLGPGPVLVRDAAQPSAARKP